MISVARTNQLIQSSLAIIAMRKRARNGQAVVAVYPR